MTDKEIMLNCARQEFRKYDAIQSNDDNKMDERYVAYIKSIGLSDLFDLLKNSGFDLEEIKKGGLTTERLKSLIEELILKSYNRDENKDFLDALKIYISKFEVENKTKQSFITILPKNELKSCPYCKKEI